MTVGSGLTWSSFNAFPFDGPAKLVSTTDLTKPCRLFLPDESRRGSSLPIVGSTLSLADKLTNSANGTIQTQRPKYEAISVKVGMSGWS